MNLRLIAVGKLKEAYLKDAAEEYKKRLSRYLKVECIEIQDERIPDRASAAEEDTVREKEGEKILGKIGANDFVIALCVEGKQKSSEEFASLFSSLALSGKSTVTMIIGGSLGLSEKVKGRADLRLGVSKMTFPHQLFRVMLFEQVYRAQKILAGETYHK